MITIIVLLQIILKVNPILVYAAKPESDLHFPRERLARTQGFVQLTAHISIRKFLRAGFGGQYNIT